MARKYATEEERLEARRARKRKYSAKWRAEHKAEKAEYDARYRQEHKEEIAKYREEHKDEIVEIKRKYLNTKEGRASNLIRAYKQEDKKRGRGDIDLTVPWFIRNIFTKCIYCGESDWKKLGCDRIDNSKAHTMENVVPSCWDCNNKRQSKPFEQFYWEMKHKTLGD